MDNVTRSTGTSEPKPPLRCLLVEDSEDDAQLVLQRLRSGGFDVKAERVDSAEAMRAALQRQPWDAVISDYRMPGFSGLDALALTKAHDQDMPFILISGHMGEELAVEAMRAGAGDYLTKDHLQRLAPAVQRELHEAATRRAHRQAEAALRLSEARHAAILMSALDGYWLVDSNGRIVEVNQASAQMSGYSIDELLTMGIVDLEDAESAGDTAAHLQKIHRLGVDRFDTRHRRKDGSVYDVEVSAQTSADGSGLTVGFLRDVTERNLAAAALHASEAQLRFVTDHAPIMIAHCDQQRRYKFVNLAYAQMFGLQPADLIGRHTHEVLGKNGYAQADPHMAIALSGQRVEYDIEISPSARSRLTLHVMYAPEFDAADQAVIGFVAALVDITERKQSEMADTFLAQAGIDPDGEAFFPALARFLASSLQMDYICIDRLEGDQLTATTLAVWHDGGFKDNLSYALADTPCGQVPGQKVCCYPASVSAFFPKDAALQQLQAESYIGVPLLSHTGVPIGLIAVIGRQRLVDRTRAEALLARVAPRAAAELERLAVETALRESEVRFRSIFEQAPIGVAEVDSSSGAILGANLRFAEIIGRSIAELRTLGWKNFANPDDIPDGVDLLARMKSGAISGFELDKHHRRPDGSYVWIHLSIAPVFDGARGNARHLCMVQDTSERKRAEEALRASHAVLAKFNALAVGRELRMIELKSEINELCARLGEPPRHHVVATLPVSADPC